ncbi:hypothetical protein EV702DRAFT_220415 [Suillus placidus]|uniref:Uncharacterized protein n=1 Tax=Suillus placidus TaxID=48579 RepID=A0A9P7D2E6_9AGAM|nr:hypothetical protein EV702DRAFT_220415 [Suillus placidus]
MLPFSIPITYGAYFLSTILCAILWGVSCMQTFSYFTCYVRDDRWLKTTVAVIFTINTAQTALIVHGAYAYLVIHFGDSSFFEVVLPVSSEYLLSKHKDSVKRDQGCSPRSGFLWLLLNSGLQYVRLWPLDSFVTKHHL